MHSFERHSDSLHSVMRVFSILEVLGEKGACSVSDIVIYTKIPMKTVSRLLQTMRMLAYVKQVEEKYFLTFRLFELGARILEHNNLTELAVVHMRALKNSINETVNLGVLVDNGKVHYLRSLVAEHEVCSVSIIKNGVPVYSSALGKVMTAWLDEMNVRELLSDVKFIPYTEKTILCTDDYMRSLAKVRKLGYAEDNEESERGLCCIAAPIYNKLGRVIAGISISIPSERICKKSQEQLLFQLHKSAGTISKLMGYRFYPSP